MSEKKHDIWIELKLFGDYDGVFLKIPLVKEFFPTLENFINFVKKLVEEGE